MWRPSAIADAVARRPRRARASAGPVPSAPDAVERARDDPRGRGLADAADAGQQEGVRDPPGAQRVGERAHQRLLADQLGQALRPVGAREHAIGLAPLQRRRSTRVAGLASTGCARRARASPGQEAGAEWRSRRELAVRPGPCSLRLLPSGPDRVGEWTVRPPAPLRQYRASAGDVQAAMRAHAVGGDPGWLRVAPPRQRRRLDEPAVQSTAASLHRRRLRPRRPSPARRRVARDLPRRPAHPGAPDVRARGAGRHRRSAARRDPDRGRARPAARRGGDLPRRGGRHRPVRRRPRPRRGRARALRRDPHGRRLAAGARGRLPRLCPGARLLAQPAPLLRGLRRADA